MTLTASAARLTLRSLAVRSGARPTTVDADAIASVALRGVVDDEEGASSHSISSGVPSSVANRLGAASYCGEWVGCAAANGLAARPYLGMAAAAAAATSAGPEQQQQQQQQMLITQRFFPSPPSSTSSSGGGNAPIANFAIGRGSLHQQQPHRQPWMAAAAEGFASALGGRRRIMTAATIPKPRTLATTTNGNQQSVQRSESDSSATGGGGGGVASPGELLRLARSRRVGGDRSTRTPVPATRSHHRIGRMMDLRNPARASDILSIVRDEPGEVSTPLTPACVSTAFNRLGKMARARDFAAPHRLQRITADETFRELLRLARDFASEAGGDRRCKAVETVLTINGIAKLHEARRLDATDATLVGALAALDTALGRVAEDLNPQEVSMTIWAYAKLGRAPGDDAWEALDTAVARVAPSMIAQGVTNVMWAYAALGSMPGDDAWAALDSAAERVARDVKAQEAGLLHLAHFIFSS